jgi:hypothetical protein
MFLWVLEVMHNLATARISFLMSSSVIIPARCMISRAKTYQVQGQVSVPA